jgi:predicted esterase YcpF (UPF0227 family)
MLYIYIHGFNSAFDPESQKIQLLCSIGKVVGVNYNSFDTYKSIFEDLYTNVQNLVTNEDVVFVGTSLGGFWAAEMARLFRCPSILINPCYDPYIMLRKLVGTEMSNYQTGEVNTLTNTSVETYPSAMTGADRTFKYLPLVFLDMGDEIIDSHETAQVLYGFPMKTWEDGSHRFDHMEEALEHILEYLDFCNWVKNPDIVFIE